VNVLFDLSVLVSTSSVYQRFSIYSGMGFWLFQNFRHKTVKTFGQKSQNAFVQL